MEAENKNTLLIVDDENANLKILSHILGSDYVIFTASSGQSAIEKAKLSRPDLILMDIMMPDMDGYQTLSMMKAIEEIRDIPVVFITGLDSAEDEVKGLTLRAADYIIKPFSAPVVKLRVQNQIELVRLHKELEAAVKAAEAANRSKSVFLAKMSHEIRTPLNAVLGISQMHMYKDNALLAQNPQEIKEAFTRIYNSGDLLLGIIDDILDTSKIEAGKLEIVPEKYDFESLINDTIFLNMIKFQNKPVKFILNVDEKIPSSLFGDEIRIKQILNNLLSNAFKYTPSGEIELSVNMEKSSNEKEVVLLFTVRDTGQGMNEVQVEKIFDEYSRFNLEKNRAIEGTGLGMSILQNITHLMNGEITVKSESGKGSLFTVRLPQGNVGAAVLGREKVEKMKQFRSNYEAKMKKEQVVYESLPHVKALVVDDIDINNYVVKEMLLPYGMKIDTAGSGVEAVEMVQKNDYDIVFMDHIMPIMDGIEAVKQIRKLGKKHENLHIIALTANAVSGTKEMFLANGFNGFLSKPVSMHDLDEVIRNWTRK
jgi:signal transduction histidine kinase